MAARHIEGDLLVRGVNIVEFDRSENLFHFFFPKYNKENNKTMIRTNRKGNEVRGNTEDTRPNIASQNWRDIFPRVLHDHKLHYFQ